ncbi:MAG TPA: UDP-N-acetylmuramoyl-L-alanyl-D-glutamate--2,6-diaminopimelate ligase [Candidatus Pacearchaeota archaeon]|nr:UDP-N-acetylmuramoyl-L-alanyl-D-glutamate--2,6-diaminopimelate ligase [Candidatus Pacearchaeota archaeon]HRR94829.1 UDP-N-acetylmuramoyl-L-alanyl-D-glutamate--2,6-diaminopimelate ligase [Candidatus Paceibacterota bacterium]HPC30622.1 UDP-N-acetylmuramoyl-L-alanyl-D-glutamate--2,6-diaminopimelate ligase [Candidatus Pacearchaeota archaeon]HQG09517.1 UDP-N-acetylmuramoyl-L-alanyl-D-glutamate--2,6-diaminopimelate ligase [Candidatus Pacearchaeota archaeon]HQH20235.1 UDP-N-acetylmuramoyl-L-alanyl-
MTIKNYIRKLFSKRFINFYHLGWAFCSALWYGFPSKKIKVIGVTGTNGKSTTINIACKIFEKAGYKTAALTSIAFKIREEERENKLKMTMPGRHILNKFLSEAVKAKCDFAFIETTSEGVAQNRHKFINFQTAVITNLNPEHIEAHGSFENYKQAKGKFFAAVPGTHIINIDDKYADYFLSFSAKRIITYAIENKTADIVAKNAFSDYNGSYFEVDNNPFNLKILCSFNIYNALAAIAIAQSEKIDLSVCSEAISEVEQVPGRMEKVIDSPFQVFVDYAFVPEALEKVYQFVKPEKGRLICVLGSCGGGRDKWKRPILGGIASQYGDIVIVTNEDPYDENPKEIIEAVSAGVKDKNKLIKIFDRREAIHKALSLAGKGDTVVITGKGCEPWICWENGRKEAWDDRQVVKEELAKICK